MATPTPALPVDLHNRIDGAHLPRYARAMFAITPSDVADLPFIPLWIRAGSAGTLALVDTNGAIVTLTNVVAGETIRIRAKGVRATGTTVTGLVGFH